MFLVDDDDKFRSRSMCFRNAVEEVLSLTVPDGSVAFLGHQFPVDKSGAFSRESVLERIK